ncbi:MAG: DinB family protein [Phycisphaerales bacterium]
MIESLRTAIEPLERTPRVLREMLGGIDDTWARSNYGPDTFSPFDVVGHLLHADRVNWLARARHILARDTRPFEPFDRYAMYETDKNKSMETLLEEFARTRRESLDTLAALNITPEHFTLPATHPDLGPVNLGQLLSTWVVHDLHHTAQITKAMAFQLKNDVGPWRQYLAILQKT